MNTAKLLKTAQRAALAAGKLQMRHFGKLKAAQISQKSRNDFVTEVDKASEKLILGIIRKEFPRHAIQAEESGTAAGESTCWVIDPLDGTSNYIHQFPMFSVSIGVRHEEETVAAVVYDPLHKEMFTAEKGCGAKLNGRPIHVSPVKKLADALMATGIPFRARNRFEEYFDSLKKIAYASAGLRRGGSAALDLAYTACGRFEGFWEINLSAWDIAAGELLIREAGGHVSDLWNKNAFMQSGDILGSNKSIHQELLAITSTTFTPKP